MTVADALATLHVACDGIARREAALKRVEAEIARLHNVVADYEWGLPPELYKERDAAYQRAEAAEAEVVREAQARATLRDGLRRIEEQQPKTLDWLRANGIIFDGPLGTDPDNWEHVAFAIYTDLCETDSIARALLAEDGAAETGDTT